MKDGRKLLAELGELKPGEVYFRAHNLLSTGDGTPAFKWGSTNAYIEDAQGRPVYDWTTVDRIIDTYLARGVRPYLQIGFMPQAMSTAPKGVPYQHPWRPGFDYKLIATGWTYPPESYQKWAELVHQWTLHNVARYGRAEVERWYFEVWNEPNIDFYWQGSAEEFHKLHDHAIDAVRRALPTARVGGPDVAGAVRLTVNGVTARGRSATLWRVDGDHANSFAAWRAMGAPIAPDATQYATLERASALRPEPVALTAGRGGTVTAAITVPRQGVALVVLDGR